MKTSLNDAHRDRKKESNDLYGQEEFWNKRYKDQSIYEWYLPFESLKDHIFPDLNACSNLRGEILVAGCGNSTLCEDLWHSGELQLIYSVISLG